MRRIAPLVLLLGLAACPAKPPASLSNLELLAPSAGKLALSGDLSDADGRPTRSPGRLDIIISRVDGVPLCRLAAPVKRKDYDDMGWFRVTIPWPGGCKLPPGVPLRVERAFVTEELRLVAQGGSGPYLEPPAWLTESLSPEAVLAKVEKKETPDALWTSLMETFKVVKVPTATSPACRVDALEALLLDAADAKARLSALRLHGGAMNKLAAGEDPAMVFAPGSDRETLQAQLLTNDYFRLMATDRTAPREDAPPADEVAALEQASRYVLVLWPVNWVWPRVTKLPTKDKAGRRAPGHFRGVAALVDRVDKRAVCWKRLKAGSSPAGVEWSTERETTQESAQQVVDLDLIVQVKRAAREAFLDLAPELVAVMRESPSALKF